MKTLTVSSKHKDKKSQDDFFLMRAAKKEDVDFIYEGSESIRVEDENSKMLFTLIRGAIPQEATKNYYHAIVDNGAIASSKNRGTAAGVKPEKKIRKDGSISNTYGSVVVESSIIGFLDRYPRTNFCRKTAWTQSHPENWATIEKYTKKVNDVYKKFCPQEYDQHFIFAGKTSPDFLINGTAFTTITLNRNFQTHYHRDAGNLEQGFAAMTYMKKGKFSGGEVVFPNYRCAAKLRNFDLIVFRNTEIHGNLPIESIRGNENYERITSVFFYRKNMIFCGTAQEELARAKRNKGDQIIGPTTEDLNKGRWCANKKY